MKLDQFTKILTNFGEIQFTFEDKQFMVSGFWVKPFCGKGHAEYWLFPPPDMPENEIKFDTIEGLLQYEILGRKLKEIPDEIIIVDRF